MTKIAVVAVGGNSLIKDSRHQTVEDQFRMIAETVTHLMAIIRAGYRLVITHGNGPQVGFILLRSYLSRTVLHEVPLYSCVADTQGALGFQFQLAFYNESRKQHLPIKAATVVTQVRVRNDDPAFSNPAKPIGPFYTAEEAEHYRREAGWTIVEDSGRGYRRVVASPEPVEIIELDAIRQLLADNHVVIAAGGGGIPVYLDERDVLQPTLAVIDKDLASSLLAATLGAELFLISTAVEHAYFSFGTPQQRPIRRMTVKEAEQAMSEGHFHKGSMKPKIDAAIRFLRAARGRVIITCPEAIEPALRDQTGTHLVNDE